MTEEFYAIVCSDYEKAAESALPDFIPTRLRDDLIEKLINLDEDQAPLVRVWIVTREAPANDVTKVIAAEITEKYDFHIDAFEHGCEVTALKDFPEFCKTHIESELVDEFRDEMREYRAVNS